MTQGDPINAATYWRDMQQKMREVQCPYFERYPDAILACGLPRGHEGPHNIPDFAGDEYD